MVGRRRRSDGSCHDGMIVAAEIGSRQPWQACGLAAQGKTHSLELIANQDRLQESGLM